MGVSNIKLRPCNVTWGTDDLGILDGNIEIKFAQKSVEIKGHQFGDTVLDKFNIGGSAEVSLTLQETDKATVEKILGINGGSQTPSAGTLVVGSGDAGNFKSQKAAAKKLVLNPVAKGSADHTEDFAFWLAYPEADGISLDPSKPSVVKVKFTVFRDESKPSDMNMWVYGDHTQTLT